jgi:3-hydroxyisobutyrate dehydrogenase-like beta-hydroxyacid dehydrogenase
MARARVGLLHPGEMGASVGAALIANGESVVWASDGRSPATAGRAGEAGLEDVGDLAALVRTSTRIVSVCPPAAATDQAHRVRDLDFAGVYVDANAVSPETARGIAAIFEGSAVDFVDGGIVGPPAHRSGTTRLHLAGARAAEVADWFSGSPLEAIVVDGPAGAASALKMVFAAWTKGTTALLAAIYATARAEGVDREILAEWEKAVPDLPQRLRRGVPATTRKAWRFVGEMREIAATLEGAGLPAGFHEAAAEVYERLAEFKDAPEPPDVDVIADRLRQRGARAQRRGMKTTSPLPSIVPNCGVCWLREAFVTWGFT